MSETLEPCPDADTLALEEEGEAGDGSTATDPLTPAQEIQELPEIKYECKWNLSIKVF